MNNMFKPRIRTVWLILAILCLLYSAVVYMVGSGTFSFAIWLCGAGFFAVCFFLAGNGRWARVSPVIRRITYAVLAALLVVFISCEAAILSHFFDKGKENLDYIIVLGAQMREDGPSVIYRYRLLKACEYLKDNPDTKCIVTGGMGINENVTEGEGGAEYLVSLGIPSDRIIIEKESEDTSANIRNALDLITEDESDLEIGIITNGFHVFRGVSIARKNTDAEIYGIAAYQQPQYIPNNLVRECFGILRDLIYRKI